MLDPRLSYPDLSCLVLAVPLSLWLEIEYRVDRPVKLSIMDPESQEPLKDPRVRVRWWWWVRVGDSRSVWVRTAIHISYLSEPNAWRKGCTFKNCPMKGTRQASSATWPLSASPFASIDQQQIHSSMMPKCNQEDVKVTRPTLQVYIAPALPYI